MGEIQEQEGTDTNGLLLAAVSPELVEEALAMIRALPRAKWVDLGKSKPKKHGVFETYLKGDPHHVTERKWTGRNWYFKDIRGKWQPSAFGLAGDRFRGLAVDPEQAIRDFLASKTSATVPTGTLTDAG